MCEDAILVSKKSFFLLCYPSMAQLTSCQRPLARPGTTPASPTRGSRVITRLPRVSVRAPSVTRRHLLLRPAAAAASSPAEPPPLKTRLASYGASGLASMALLNACWYGSMFFTAWATGAAPLRGCGPAAALRAASLTFAFIYGASQLTKVPRGLAILACVPLVDRGLNVAAGWQRGPRALVGGRGGGRLLGGGRGVGGGVCADCGVEGRGLILFARSENAEIK